MKYYIEKCYSHKLLDKILKQENNISEYEIIHNKYGKPYLKGIDLFFNLSDSNDISALVISNKEVGIDIEELKYDELVMKTHFNNHEIKIVKNSKDKKKDFTKIWTIKEAYVKCMGTGIIEPLKNIDSNLIKCKSFTIENYYVSIVEKE